MCDGTIDTSVIYDTHRQIKQIVESYKSVNSQVACHYKKCQRKLGRKRQKMNLITQYNIFNKKNR
mgnify:CR=1 FL=1